MTITNHCTTKLNFLKQEHIWKTLKKSEEISHLFSYLGFGFQLLLTKNEQLLLSEIETKFFIKVLTKVAGVAQYCLLSDI